MSVRVNCFGLNYVKKCKNNRSRLIYFKTDECSVAWNFFIDARIIIPMYNG